MPIRLFRQALVLAAALTLTVALAQDRLVVAQGEDAPTLDAAFATTSPAAGVASHIVERLFDFTPEGTVEPLLVEDFAFAEDGLTLTLELRQGLSFHDGTPLDAEAVKFNLDRILDDEVASPFAWLLAGSVSDIQAVDTYTVVIDLSSPFAPLLTHLSHSSMGIQSPTAIRELGEDYGDQPVGTGPYRFAEWVTGEHIDLVRNDEYWGEAPEIEQIRFLAVPESSTRMALVETGEAHVAVRVPPAHIERLEDHADVIVDRTPSLRTLYFYFNTSIEPFDDVRIRQAINYAVDQEAIVEFILGGAGLVSDAAISPNVFGYTPVGTYPHDPDRARELLAEAGQPDGFELVLHSPAARYMQDVQITEAVQSQLAEVGIEATIETLEFGAYLDKVRLPMEANDVQMGMLGWGAVTGDADYGLYGLFHSTQFTPDGWNLGFYQSEALDDLLEAARTTTELEARQDLYAEALQLIHDEAPWLFLHSESQVTAIRSDVEGFIVHPAERYLGYRASFR